MNRCLLRAMPALVATLCGCAHPPADAPPETSAVFSHVTHLDFFASGAHRQEKIAMHLAAFGATEVPEDLAQGSCETCHGDAIKEMPCGSCHVTYQQAAVRSRVESRPCIGCHRGAWAGTAATLPRRDACAACHAATDGAGPAGIRAARVAWTGPEYAGGIRASSLPPNVYFSHRAHVRVAGMACDRCHTGPATASGLPSVPAFAMNDCLRCHVESGARTDCLTCHK